MSYLESATLVAALTLEACVAHVKEEKPAEDVCIPMLPINITNAENAKTYCSANPDAKLYCRTRPAPDPIAIMCRDFSDEIYNRLQDFFRRGQDPRCSNMRFPHSTQCEI